MRALSKESARKLTDKFHRPIKPGQKLCRNCRKKLLKLASDDASPVHHQDDNIPAQEQIFESFNSSLAALGCTPVKTAVADSKDINYGKRKLKQSHAAF